MFLLSKVVGTNLFIQYCLTFSRNSHKCIYRVATGENRSWHGRSCIFQNPSLGLLQRIFRKLLHYEKQLKGIRNNNFSLNKPVKREI